MKNKILAAILLQVICHFSLMAGPADPTPRKITQPDGSQLTVQLIGDEFFSYYQTTDGLVIKRNSAGIFEYVTLSENDSIMLSGIKVNEIAHNIFFKTPRDRVLYWLPTDKVGSRKNIKN